MARFITAGSPLLVPISVLESAKILRQEQLNKRDCELNYLTVPGHAPPGQGSTCEELEGAGHVMSAVRIEEQ